MDRKRRKPARYQQSDNSEVDNSLNKSKKTKKRYSLITDSSDEEISTTDNIKTNVKMLLKNKENLSPSLLCPSKEHRTEKHTVHPSCSYTEQKICNASQSSILQDYSLEVNKNSAVKSFFSDGKLNCTQVYMY